MRYCPCVSSREFARTAMRSCGNEFETNFRAGPKPDAAEFVAFFLPALAKHQARGSVEFCASGVEYGVFNTSVMVQGDRSTSTMISTLAIPISGRKPARHVAVRSESQLPSASRVRRPELHRPQLDRSSPCPVCPSVLRQRRASARICELFVDGRTASQKAEHLCGGRLGARQRRREYRDPPSRDVRVVWAFPAPEKATTLPGHRQTQDFHRTVPVFNARHKPRWCCP